MTVQLAPVTGPRGGLARYLAPLALAVLTAAVIAVVASVPGAGRHSSANRAHATRSLPPYWIVRPGDSFTGIAARTGLTVVQLEALNPNTDPTSIVPGQRLKLWAHPPKPRPKPPGPLYWSVRSGDSFGSIAAATATNIGKLEQLNPRLKPTALQPGDRVRLRP